MSVQEITCKELVEVVTDYLEGRMPAERRLLFEEHVAFCSWCRTYLDQMRETIRITGTLTEDDLSPETRDALLEAFRNWNAQSR
jgi:predicted anti-sigma-YlaC factor YlaD